MINLRNYTQDQLDFLDKILTEKWFEYTQRLRLPNIKTLERQNLENDLTLISQIYDQFPTSINKIKD